MYWQKIAKKFLIDAQFEEKTPSQKLIEIEKKEYKNKLFIQIPLLLKKNRENKK